MTADEIGVRAGMQEEVYARNLQYCKDDLEVKVYTEPELAHGYVEMRTLTMQCTEPIDFP